MQNQSFTTIISVDQTPEEVFNAVNNVRGWWSEEVKGNTEKLYDEFTYHYKDVHRCTMKLIEVIPAKKVVWLVLNNHFSFTKDQNEWKDTKVVFEIFKEDDKTQLRFTHEGLIPGFECYEACSKGWSQYVNSSLLNLITTGKGQPNGTETARTTYEVAARFMELAKQEKWFDIQDELFADDVESIDPKHSPYFKYAKGKANVRKKGEDWVSKIEAAHRRYTSEMVVAGNHFAVGREVDITVKEFGRIQINELMMYEVKDGKIISEQFFY